VAGLRREDDLPTEGDDRALQPKADPERGDAALGGAADDLERSAGVLRSAPTGS